MSQHLSSAAVVIGALRVNPFHSDGFPIHNQYNEDEIVRSITYFKETQVEFFK